MQLCNPDEFGVYLASAEDMNADSGVPTVSPAHAPGPLSRRSTEDITEGNSLQLNISSNTLIPAPDTATQCWNNAVEIFNSKLKSDDKRRIDINHPTYHELCTLAEFLQAAKDAKEACDGRRTKFQQKCEEIIRTINEYSTVVDPFIQHHLQEYSIVWGTLRFLLRVRLPATVWLPAHILMIKIAAQKHGIAGQIEEGMILIVTHLRSWLQNTQNNADEGIVETTSRLFAAILKFVVTTRIHYERPYIMSFLAVGFGSLSGDIEQALSDIKLYSSYQHNLACSAEATQSIVFRQRLLEHAANEEVKAEEQETFRQEIRQHYELIDDYHRSMIAGTAERNFHSRLLDAIRVLRPLRENANFVADKVTSERSPRTCHWIFEHKRFGVWVQSNCNEILWIHGKPGCGKSVMASFLRDNTLESEHTIAHFVSASTDMISANANSLAASILLQILRRWEAIPRAGYSRSVEIINSFCQKYDHLGQISFSQLRSTVSAALAAMPEYTLIIDGLNECINTKEDLKNLQGLVEDLMVGCKNPGSKVIFLSQQHPQLEIYISKSASLPMDHEAIVTDIQCFIENKVEQYPRLQSIGRKLSDKAGESSDGVFLWAKLMIDHVLEGWTEEAQLQLLDRAPKGVTLLFEEMVSRKQLLHPEAEFRRETLLLLHSARSAFTIAELEIALQFKDDVRLKSEKRIKDVATRIQETCAPLVSLFNGRVALYHGSVKGFLNEPERDKTVPKKRSVHMTDDDSHACIASRIFNVLSEEQYQSPSRISYLLYQNASPRNSIENSGFTPPVKPPPEIIFYDYAARCWEYHLTQVSSPEMGDPAKDFIALLGKAQTFIDNNQFVHWVEYVRSLKETLTPVATVLANLHAWKALLRVDLRKYLVLDSFFSKAYRNLSIIYAKNGGDKIPQFLCLYSLGQFYALQTNLEAQLKAFQEAMEGLELALGPMNPLTLRVRASIGMYYTYTGQLKIALDLYLEVSAAQRAINTENLDYLSSIQQVAFIRFLMTDFAAAAMTQDEVTKGLRRVVGEDRPRFLTSQIFAGYIFEAQDLLDEALDLYTVVFRKRSEATERKNPSALYPQVAMGSVYRKQGKYNDALNYLNFAYSERMQIWGLDNGTTMDSAIQLIILYREIGEEGYDQANGIIELALDTKLLQQDFQRFCQIEHLRALILIDQNGFAAPRNILQSLLNMQSEKGREYNNRSLLWVRLTLATLLTDEGKGDEVSALFHDLVKIRGSGRDSARITEEIEIEKIAEAALRLVRGRKRDEAEALLAQNNLEWVRKKDFWLFEGSPSADTAWMKGP